MGVVIDFDTWFDTYQPIEKSPGNILWETHDPKDEVVWREALKEGRLWTLLDADGDLIISNGYWRINRMNYIVTEVVVTDPSGSINVEY